MQDGGHGTKSINATLLHENITGVDSSNSNNFRSGVVVQLDGSIRLYGSTTRLYRLSQGITVHKFSIMSACSFSQVPPIPQEVSICLFEDLASAVLDNCPSRCFPLEYYDTNVMSLAAAFNSRIATVRFIAFKLEGFRGDSIIKSLTFSNGTMTSIFDDDDKCVDPNARRSTRDGCVCMDGYASSNGGKIQEAYDSCVDCLTEANCAVDASFVGSGSIDQHLCSKVSILSSNHDRRLLTIQQSQTSVIAL